MDPNEEQNLCKIINFKNLVGAFLIANMEQKQIETNKMNIQKKRLALIDTST